MIKSFEANRSGRSKRTMDPLSSAKMLNVVIEVCRMTPYEKNMLVTHFAVEKNVFEEDDPLSYMQAMAELMPPSIPPSPPGSEGDAADLSDLSPFDDYCLPDQVLIDELDRVERLIARGKRLWSMLRDHIVTRSVVDYWSRLTGTKG